jgi:phage terminase large subunit
MVPEVLRAEKADMLIRDRDAYLNIWEGNCRETLAGAIYANEIRDATADGRITTVPYDRAHAVHTYWDLGRADMTAIWFAQTVGFEHRLIDYYENCGYGLDHYLRELQSRQYVYGTDYMPHDADSKLLAAEKTIRQQAEASGRKVEIVDEIGIANGINAARAIFPRCYFDRARWWHVGRGRDWHRACIQCCRQRHDRQRQCDHRHSGGIGDE